MREALFVKQNSEKWQKYELMQTPDPDELAQRFISLTDDLAYAKTFYPQSETTAYLNGLTAHLHQSIYKNKKKSPTVLARSGNLNCLCCSKSMKNNCCVLFCLRLFLH